MPPDHTGQYRERQNYESDYRRYLEDKARYERQMVERAHAQARVDAIKPLAYQFPILGQLQVDWQRYWDRLEVWEKADEEFKRLTAEADGWRRAQTALNNLRVMVKGHLVPALAKWRPTYSPR